MSLELSEGQKAWELRGHWASHRPVVLVLSERCMVRRIEGLVERVAVTGAFVVIDGWHVPVDDILAVHRPHFTQTPLSIAVTPEQPGRGDT